MRSETARRSAGALVLWALAAVVPGADASWSSVGPAGGAVRRVATAPSDARIAYLAGDGSGVFKSEDGGVSWRIASAGLTNFDVRSLAVSPANARIVLAGTDLGAFRSVDGAATWVPIGAPVPADTIDAVAFDPAGAAAYAASLSGWVGRSADAGATWQTLTTPASTFRPITITVDPTNAARIYLGTVDNGIYRSENSGSTWADINGNIGNLHISAIGVDPSSPTTLYAGTNAGAFRSIDDGALWGAFSTGAGTLAVKDLIVDSNGVAYLANINGAWAAPFASAAWQHLDLPALFANAIAAWPAAPGASARILVGTGNPPLDPGALWASDDSGGFFAAAGVNVMSVASLAVDPGAPQRVLALGTAFGSESTDGGRTWEPFTIVGFGTVIAFNPFAPGTIYEGTADAIFRTIDDGVNWERVDAGLPNSVVRAILPGALRSCSPRRSPAFTGARTAARTGPRPPASPTFKPCLSRRGPAPRRSLPARRTASTSRRTGERAGRRKAPASPAPCGRFCHPAPRSAYSRAPTPAST